MIIVQIFVIISYLVCNFIFANTLIGIKKKIRRISRFNKFTTATIIDYEHDVVWNRTTKTNIYRPIYEYVVEDKKYQNMYPDSKKSWFEKKLPTGERVKLFYDEADLNQIAPDGSVNKLKKACIYIWGLIILYMCILVYLIVYSINKYDLSILQCN